MSVLVLLSLIALACAAPSLRVSSAMVDHLTPLDVAVCGVPAGASGVRVALSEFGASSHANFDAFAPSAAVPPPMCAPLAALPAAHGSSYVGASAFGLWWARSATPAPTPTLSTTTNASTTTTTTTTTTQPHPLLSSWNEFWTLSLDVDGKIADKVDVALSYGDLVVTPFNLSSAPFVGTLYAQSGASGAPTVVVCGGSEGGQDFSTATMFASHNYTVLSLAYFNAPGLPSNLEHIPLEYFEKAVGWLRHRPEVGSKIAFYGTSRGGELAVQLASAFPTLFDIVISKSGGGIRMEEAWSLNGKVLPSTSPATGDACRADSAASFADELVSDMSFVCILGNTPNLADAVIDLSGIRKPLLMFSGSDDLVWNSELLFDYALKTVPAASRHLVQQHTFYDAGHAIYPSFYLTSMDGRVPIIHPKFGTKIFMGGSKTGNAAANAEMTKIIKRTFQEIGFE